MRIACLQFSPQVGKVRENMARADELLKIYAAGDFEVLVLPEMAFSGYNFTSREHITPYLEPTSAGPTAQWAKETAARLRCVVSVGYPEVDTDLESRGGRPPAATSAESAPGTVSSSSSSSPSPPLMTAVHPPAAAAASISPSATSSSSLGSGSSHSCYNSTITVSPQGKILAHYRKTHLYYTDETWAQESPTGWLTVPLVLPCPNSSSSNPTCPSPSPSSSTPTPPSFSTQTLTSFGICMDLNPHEFTAPWTLYEFATHALTSRAQLLLLSMAWLTTLPSTELLRAPLAHLPDKETWAYWCERLKPLILQTDRKVVVVVANRCGVEGAEGMDGAGGAVGGPGGAGGGKKVDEDEDHDDEEGEEDDDEEELKEPAEARYAGTSWVGELGGGEVGVWDIAGRGEEQVLVIDTARKQKWRLEVRS